MMMINWLIDADWLIDWCFIELILDDQAKKQEEGKDHFMLWKNTKFAYVICHTDTLTAIIEAPLPGCTVVYLVPGTYGTSGHHACPACLDILRWLFRRLAVVVTHPFFWIVRLDWMMFD
jgi:hypothetical protein